MTHLCPSCNNESLEATPFEQVQLIKENKVTIHGLVHNVCSNCGYTEITADQLKQNHDRRMLVAHQLNDGMTPSKIRSLREKYHLSQAKAAAIFGGGPRAFSKYETGEVTPADSMEKLLWLALQSPSVLLALAERGGVKVNAEIMHFKISIQMETSSALSQSISKEMSNNSHFKLMATPIVDSKMSWNNSSKISDDGSVKIGRGLAALFI